MATGPWAQLFSISDVIQLGLGLKTVKRTEEKCSWNCLIEFLVTLAASEKP